MKKFTRFPLVALIAAIILLSANASAQSTVPRQLLYLSNLPSDVFLLDIDSNSTLRLTANDTEDVMAQWSPDGMQIAFSSERTGNFEVYVMAADGSQSRNVTRFGGDDFLNDWSPDGRSLLFSSFRAGNSDIYRVGIDGGETTALTTSLESEGDAVFSPNSSHIAFIRGYPSGQLMLMHSDGSHVVTLVDELDVSTDVGGDLAWSPDGTQIAFIAETAMIRGAIPSEIYVINADGTDLRQLTDNGNVNLGPVWSPDGTQIAFWGYAPGAFDPGNDDEQATEVYVMDASGENIRNLTQSSGLDSQPAWSPDGSLIAFSSFRMWNDEGLRGGIFIMNPDGSDVRRVTDLPGRNEASSPLWRPVGGNEG
jgi:TolB protein